MPLRLQGPTGAALASSPALTGTFVSPKPARGGQSKAYELSKTSGATVPGYRILVLGDSVRNFKWRFSYDLINRAYGGMARGASVGNGSSDVTTGTWSLPGIAYALAGGASQAVADFDAWFSGYTYRVPTTGTVTATIGGAAPRWDTAKVYYVKGPGANDGGTFKVQVGGVDSAGNTNVATSNASVSLGVITLTQAVGTANVSVAGLTGNVRIIGMAFFDSTVGGAVFSDIGQGGISLDDATSAGALATLGAYIADYNPDIITLEGKESSSYMATAAARLFTTIAANTATATVVGIGSTPIASGDADQVIQNGQLKTAAEARGFLYWDSYTPVKDYATLVALGWQGDGTHVDDKANAYLAGLFVRDLGLIAHPSLTRGSLRMNTGTAWVDKRLDVGPKRTDNDPLSAFALDTTTGSGLDTLAYVRRTLKMVSSTGTPDASSWLIQPDNGSDQQIPSGIRVGTTGPWLQSSAGTLQVYSARSGGAVRDVFARAYLRENKALTYTSGTLALDLSLASLFLVTLQANVSAISITNVQRTGQEIEIHFLQDATGSRTLPAFGSPLFVAGGALTATTTPSKRDILKMTFHSGGWYETSRSLNVG